MTTPSSAPPNLTLQELAKLCRSGPGENEPAPPACVSSKWAAASSAPINPNRAVSRPVSPMTRPATEDLDVLLTAGGLPDHLSLALSGRPALAPVRDLAVLDPYNRARWRFRWAALNEHIASLPSLKEHGSNRSRPHA